MENFNVFIGSLVKDLRESKGISQRSLSIILKKDPSLISYWESGRRQMNIGDLIMYLDAIKATDKEKDDLFRTLMKVKSMNYEFDYKVK